MKIFKDRQAAGKLLAEHLKDTKADLVLGIPRGGVVVAVAVARQLKLPLDVIITRKIGSPIQPELALGAVDPDGEVVWDNELLSQLEIKISNLKFIIEESWKELKRREDLYRNGNSPQDVVGKTVILVDDGIATGATVLAAAVYLKRHQVGKLILAVPIASLEAMKRISTRVDEVVVLHSPEDFQAVGQFYQEFNPVSDEEVVEILRHCQLL